MINLNCTRKELDEIITRYAEVGTKIVIEYKDFLKAYNVKVIDLEGDFPIEPHLEVE